MQVVLGIKRSKRESLEQKVFFDMITKGEGPGDLKVTLTPFHDLPIILHFPVT